MSLAIFFILLLALLVGGIFVFRLPLSDLMKDTSGVIQLEERTAYMAELEHRSQQLDSAFNKALLSSLPLTHPIQVLSWGHYQVRGKQGSVHNVYIHEVNGDQLLECDCDMYNRNLTCSHFVAAASLHASLLEHVTD